MKVTRKVSATIELDDSEVDDLRWCLAQASFTMEQQVPVIYVFTARTIRERIEFALALAVELSR